MARSLLESAWRGWRAGGPTLADVGETRLLEQLVDIAALNGSLGSTRSGDDAAVWTPPPGRDLAVSIDALVEGVDFRRSWIAPHQLGRRALAVAVSDLAGTGAEPVHCVATLCAAGSEQLDDMLEIQSGLCQAAAEVGCAVIGGDVSATAGPLVIDVSVTGTLPHGQALRRRAGRAGDALLVTGTLGRAAAGLRLLLDGVDAATDAERSWIDAQLQPRARVCEGRELLARAVGCGGDVSDGLIADAGRTARASGCAADLWVASLPVDRELAIRFSHEWLELAAAGGEDFELLVAVPQPDVAALLAGWPATLAPLTQVGILREGTGVRLLAAAGAEELPPPPGRAAHFS